MTKSSTSSIQKILDEQLYQNQFFDDYKITTYFYGSPGIGKTEIVKNYPLYRLQQLNNKLLKYQNIDKIIEYNYFEPIEDQHKKLGLEDYNLQVQSDTVVITVSQADIIVPEDISGLPSSSSEIRLLLDKYRLANMVGNGEVIRELRTSIDKALSVNNRTSERNTTKFDYTEWEYKIHEVSKLKHIVNIILLLDDITRSAVNNITILNVLMPLFQSNMVGLRKLPNNCSIVVTSNENDENNQFYIPELDSAQNDRLFKTKVEFDINSWRFYATNNKLHQSAIDFTKLYPRLFNKITPRRWTQFGKMLYNRFGTEPLTDADLDIILELNFSEEEQIIVANFLRFIKPNSIHQKDILVWYIKEFGVTKKAIVQLDTLVKENKSVEIISVIETIVDRAFNNMLPDEELKNIEEIFNTIPVIFLNRINFKKYDLVDLELEARKTNDNTKFIIVGQLKQLFNNIFKKLNDSK